MRTYLFPWVILLVLAGCSSTRHYEASGYYVVDAEDGDVVAFDDQRACVSIHPEEDSCTRVLLEWETELFCGIYRRSADNVTDEQLRVGSSPTTVTGWKRVDGRYVLLGDDESFEAVLDRAGSAGSDLLCGEFSPPIDLVRVRDGDELNLRVYCRPILRGINLMPPSDEGYNLRVRRTKKEDSWFGCD